MTPIVLGVELCEDVIQPNTNCTMITPTLTGCATYNYSIHNQTGLIVTSGNLTSIGQDLYSFVFNEESGDYITLLCDGTTRESYVQPEDNMGLIIGIMVGVIAFLWLLIQFINHLDESHGVIKGIFGFVALITGVALLNLGRVLAVEYGAENLINIMNTVYTIGTWSFYIFCAYIIIYYIYQVLIKFGAIATKSK